MKYWLFENNQVSGPYEKSQLSMISGFSQDSLVCPEGRKGTQMGDWVRAGMVPELMEQALAAAGAGARSSALSGGSLLPSEPTLRDLASLGSLQERVGDIESSLTRLMQTLDALDKEWLSFKSEWADKSRVLGDLPGKIGALDSKLTEMSGALGKLSSDLESAQKSSQAQAGQLSDLRTQVRNLPAQAPQAFAPAPQPSPLFGEHEPAAPAPQPSPLFGEQPAASPFQAEVPGSLHQTVVGSVPTEPQPSILATPEPQAASEAIPGLDLPSPTTSLEEVAAPAPMEIPEEAVAAPAPKKGRSGLLLVMVLLIVGGAGAVVFLGPQYGIQLPFDIPFLPAPKAPEPAAPPPEAQAPPPQPDLGGQALALVQQKFVPHFSMSVGQKLSSQAPAGRDAWKAEQLEPGRFLVSFESKETDRATGQPVLYQFEASLALNSISGMNPPAKALLTPPAAPAPKKVRPPKAAAKPFDPSGFSDPTKAAEEFAKQHRIAGGRTVEEALKPFGASAGGLSPWMVEPLGKERYQVNFYSTQSDPDSGRKVVYEFEADLKALRLSGLNPRTQSLLAGSGPAPAPKKAPARKGKSKEEAVLDQMLLPGIPADRRPATPPKSPSAPPAQEAKPSAPPEEGGQEEADMDDLDNLLNPR